MSAKLEAISEAIVAALENHPAEDVLAIVTGSFVGLTVEMVRRQGADVTKEIKIDGCGNRDVTIHPPKDAAHGITSGKATKKGGAA